MRILRFLFLFVLFCSYTFGQINLNDSTKIIIQKKFPKINLQKIEDKIIELKANQNVNVDTTGYTEKTLSSKMNEEINKLRIKHRNKNMEELTNSYIMKRLRLTGNDSVDIKILKSFTGFDKTGRPHFRSFFNADAANTIRTDLVWYKDDLSNDYLLDGNGVKIGLWDEGRPFLEHNEFLNNPFLNEVETGGENEEHTTKVLGAMVAEGNNSEARGMAKKAT